MAVMLERDIHNGLVKYIKLQYPQAYIHSGLEGLHLPAKARLTIIKQGGQRGYPDLSIYLNGTALHIELKREGTRLKKKNGEWASEHIEEQAKWLSVLKMCNIDAECFFAIGFDAAKAVIDYVLHHNYMNEHYPDLVKFIKEGKISLVYSHNLSI